VKRHSNLSFSGGKSVAKPANRITLTGLILKRDASAMNLLFVEAQNTDDLIPIYSWGKVHQ